MTPSQKSILYKLVRKYILIEMKGGGCEKCGYNSDIRALTFHHLNPEKKSFPLSTLGLGNSWDAILKEVDKTQLLCIRCHFEEESRIKNTPTMQFLKELKESRRFLTDGIKTYDIKCGYCDKVFTIEDKSQKYCSRECFDLSLTRHLPKDVTIEEIINSVDEIGPVLTGEKYLVSTETIRKWNHNFHNGIFPPSYNNNKGKEQTEFHTNKCEFCNSEFSTLRKNKRFCNTKCLGKSQRKELPSGEELEKIWEKRTLKQIAEEFGVSVSTIRRKIDNYRCDKDLT
jgi:hypothetical protein